MSAAVSLGQKHFFRHKSQLRCAIEQEVIFVMFYTNSCTHCHHFLPIFNEIAEQSRGITFATCNLDKHEEVAHMSEGTVAQDGSDTTIEEVPFLILFIYGTPYSKFNDERSSHRVVEFLQSNFDDYKRRKRRTQAPRGYQAEQRSYQQYPTQQHSHHHPAHQQNQHPAQHSHYGGGQPSHHHQYQEPPPQQYQPSQQQYPQQSYQEEEEEEELQEVGIKDSYIEYLRKKSGGSYGIPYNLMVGDFKQAD